MENVINIQAPSASKISPSTLKKLQHLTSNMQELPCETTMLPPEVHKVVYTA